MTPPDDGPERVASPPTVRQGSPETAVQGGGGTVSPPTFVQHGDTAGSPRTAVQGEGGGAAEGGEALRGAAQFPPELLAEYEPLGERGRGTEGVVWEARRRSDDETVAVKVHWAERPIDLDLLRHLKQNGYDRHAPRLGGFGKVTTPYGTVGWVEMEYFTTSLEDVIAAEGAGGPMPDDRVRALLAALAEALEYWRDPVDRIPIDFKPDNLMFRRAADGSEQIVVTDFGGVARATVTGMNGQVIAAPGYTAPEGVIGLRRPESPWWSLGEIVYLMLTGATHHANDITKRGVRETFVLDVEMPLDGVTDRRWRSLLAGLFTRHYDDRWGSAKVRAWLAGENPDVIRPTSLPGHGTRRATNPITFRGAPYDNPRSLAEAMAEDSEEAARWLLARGNDFAKWLLEDVGNPLVDLRTLGAVSPDTAPLLVLDFVVTYAPDVVPTLYGVRLDAEGLAAHADTDDTVHARLFGSDALRIAARRPCGHAGCDHQGRPEDRCAVLLRVADDVPMIMRLVEDRVASLRAEVRAGPGESPTTWDPLNGRERANAYMTAITLTLGAGESALPVTGGGTAQRTVLRLTGGRLIGGPAWWRTLRTEAAGADPASLEGRVLATTVEALRERAAQGHIARRAVRKARAGSDLTEAVGRGLLGALLALLMLMFSTWSGTVLGRVYRDDIDLEPTERLTQTGALLGRAGADGTVAVLPALIVLSLLIAAAWRHHGPLLAATGVLAFTAACLPRWMPASHALPVPDFAAGLLSDVGAVPGRWIGPVAVLAVICALPLGFGARAALRRGVDARGRYEPLVRARTLAQRPLGTGAIVFASCTALLWTSIIVRTVYAREVPLADTSGAGRAAADVSVAHLPILVPLAVVAGWGARRGRTRRGQARRGQARDVFQAGLATTVVIAIWPDLFDRGVTALRDWLAGESPTADSVLGGLLHIFINPISEGLSRWLAGIGGAGTFWTAVLVFLPVAVLGYLVVDDR
ncbi:protein kinase domain-containing protein [Actinomadura geliboluensis]|uniref:protein kinase domain-containing protein n=1 Tax=Actinomadura geliboluensis TaxID=882440 RepID=UPI00371EDAF8